MAFAAMVILRSFADAHGPQRQAPILAMGLARLGAIAGQSILLSPSWSSRHRAVHCRQAWQEVPQAASAAAWVA